MMNNRMWVVLALFLFLCGLATPVAGAQATVNTDVPPRKWKAVRLRNLPKGALVAVEAEVSGEIAVALMDTDNYRRFPAVTRPLFTGQIEKRLSFSVSIPAAGDYFVVFDNRSGGGPRAVTVTVRATRGDQSDLRSAEEKLREFEGQLHQIFVFEPFPIRARTCDSPKAFSGEFGIVLCREYAQMLYASLGDKAKASDALLFTIFHEVGHVLLAQWRYPFFDNEEVADEFATAVMVMLGQKKRLHATAEFFATNPSVAEAIAKAFRDDRHPISAQRARNIVRWANDHQLVRKWQTVLVPHMQTAMLERLRQKPTTWTNAPLVEKELADRR